VSYNKVAFELTINEKPFTVYSLEGEEKISESFCFIIRIKIQNAKDAEKLLGCVAQLTLINGITKKNRYLYGYIQQLDSIELAPQNHWYYSVSFCSPLTKLTLQGGPKVFYNKTIPYIIKKIFMGVAVPHQSITFYLQDDYNNEPFIQQLLYETDWEFLKRLINKAGLYFWTSATKEGHHAIFVSDHHLEELICSQPLMVVPENSHEAMSASFIGIHHATLQKGLAPSALVVQDFNENRPHSLISSATCSSHPMKTNKYGLGTLSQNTVDKTAALLQEAYEITENMLFCKSNCIDIGLGIIYKLDRIDSNFINQFEDYYFIYSIKHQFVPIRQPNNTQVQAIYSNELIANSADNIYRSMHKVDKNPIPNFLCGFIESNGKYAFIDGQGCYKGRLHYDDAPVATTEAMPWVRRMMPYGGGVSRLGLPVGWHMPWYNGTEVVYGFLQDDPSRPFILGALPNSNNKSPVTNQNRYEHIWRTPGYNELILNDTPNIEKIELQTKQSLNKLLLDNTKDKSGILLKSLQGEIRFAAKKDINWHTGLECKEKIGLNLIEEIGGSQFIKTQNNLIQAQIQEDFEINTINELQLASLQSIHWQAGKEWDIEVVEESVLHAKLGDICIKVIAGDLQIEAAGNIEVTGDGTGTIECGHNNHRAGFLITPEGSIEVFGTQIHIAAETITLQGMLNQMPETGGLTPPIPSVAPLEPSSPFEFTENATAHNLTLVNAREEKIGQSKLLYNEKKYHIMGNEPIKNAKIFQNNGNFELSEITQESEMTFILED